MKTYKAQWKRLPRSIAGEYTRGATVEAIAKKHNSNSGAVRVALRSMKVKMRRPGTLAAGQVHRNTKLTTGQVQEILYIDTNEPQISHSEIGKHYGVSRERIRQICFAAGNITRRDKLIPQSMIKQEAITARKVALRNYYKNLSRAWKAGVSLDDLSMLMYGERKKGSHVMSRISYLRDVYGVEMFPYRRKNHWQLMTITERAHRVKDIAREWNNTGDIKRIKQMFGYASINSAQVGMYRMMRQWPDLFDSKKGIFKRKLEQTTQKEDNTTKGKQPQ